MEAVLIAINKVLDIKIVQWILLCTCVFVVPTLMLKVYWYKYDNAMLKSLSADLGSAIHLQNTKIKELGEQAESFKSNYEKANIESKKIAIEGQKTLQEILKTKLIGTCEDKVKQSLELLRGDDK